MDTIGSSAGLTLFTRFAYAPNERGYCGPQDHRLLLAYLEGATPDGRLADLVRQFSGPLPYLRSIAEAIGSDDPFRQDVVEAYWIGSEALDRVDSAGFGRDLQTAFGGAPSVDPQRISATTPGGLPHHSYHVFVTYPWIDFIVGGRPEAVQVLDQCRIRWGAVIDIGDGVMTVGSRPLVVADGRLVLGDVRTEEVILPPGGGPIAPGDHVACHWQWVCGRLTNSQLNHLKTTSAGQLALANDRLLGAGEDQVIP